MQRFKLRWQLAIVGIIIISIICFASYKLYIHYKYFVIEDVRYERVKDGYTYNSRWYGFDSGSFYKLYRDREIVRFNDDYTQEAFSTEGDIVFNHLGQLFLRDRDLVYEVTNDSVDFLFEIDSLDYAQRIGDKVYYVAFIYNGANKDSYYELYEYDDESMSSTAISRVVGNSYSRFYDELFSFIVEDDWLIFLDAETTFRFGLYNLNTGELHRVIEFGTLLEGSIEDVRINDGNINFSIVDYGSLPSYGEDDITVNGSEDYCYDIDTGNLYSGDLDINIVIQKDENAIKENEIDYVVHMDDDALNALFNYIEAPVLVEPDGDLYDYDILSNELFSFEDERDVDVYYSFNQPNVIKYGQLYIEPFLMPITNDRYMTNIYYYCVDNVTGQSSRISSKWYHTY